MGPQIVSTGSPCIQRRKSSVTERSAADVLMDILSSSVLLDPGDVHSLVYRVNGIHAFPSSSTSFIIGYIEFCWKMVMGKMRVLYYFPHISSSFTT